MMPSFVHIINPFSAPAGSDLARHMPVTFASIQRAVEEAKGKVNVQICSAQFTEDRSIVPEWITKTRDLDRSMLNFGTFHEERKLPLLQDVLARALEASDADYVVYSNIDICLMPSFYLAIDAYAAKGYDAFAINRRRIPSRWHSPEELHFMYAEAGEPHPGYDTLVFKRSLFSGFLLGNVCIGVPRFDTVLMHNFYAFAENFRLFTGKHLTFHIGMELVREWGQQEHYAHNEKEYRRILKELYPRFRIEQFPGANLPFFRRHFKWFWNPTFHYPTMFRLDLSQLSRKRRPRNEKEVKGMRNRFFEGMSRRINFDDEY